MTIAVAAAAANAAEWVAGAATATARRAVLRERA